MGRPKPQPVVTAQVCSICGLPWDDHGPDATIEECVELLKQTLERARTPAFQIPSIQTIPGGGFPQYPGWSPNICQAGVQA